MARICDVKTGRWRLEAIERALPKRSQDCRSEHESCDQKYSEIIALDKSIACDIEFEDNY
jgi:hypothetical protein